MVIFWICIIIVIIYVLNNLIKGGQQPETALDILKKRYAAGGISKEEFEQMKRNILS